MTTTFAMHSVEAIDSENRGQITKRVPAFMVRGSLIHYQEFSATRFRLYVFIKNPMKTECTAIDVVDSHVPDQFSAQSMFSHFNVMLKCN